jgi:uncharacterized iron-regulated membrane protein
MSASKDDMNQLPAREKTKSKKRKLFELHTWLGFHLALIMSIILFTGTIAVVSDEIDWIIQEDMRVTPGDEKVSWGVMEAAVRAAAPDHMLGTLSAGEADYFAYRATMLPPSQKRYYLHVNQWTGEVTGTTQGLTVQRFFRDLHRYLFMPNYLGLPIVSAFAFILIISLYTGLKTAGKLGTVATRLRRDKGMRIFIGDLHKAAGVWSIWFFVVVTVTSIWYLAEFGAAIGGTRFEPNRPTLAASRVAEFGDVLRQLPADQLVARAKAELPDWEPTSIQYPVRPNQPVTVLGMTDNILLRSRANRVFLDPIDGTPIKVQSSEDIGWVAFVNEMADPLHFGSFGHLTTKLIWFTFGIAMTGLSFTGVWLTYRRLKSVIISRAQVATLPIVFAAMAFGYFYLERFIDSSEDTTVLASVRSDVDGFMVSTSLQEGSDTGKRFVETYISHPEGRPLVLEAQLDLPSGKLLELKHRTFGKTTILRGDLDSDVIWQPSQLTLHLATGRALVQRLTF